MSKLSDTIDNIRAIATAPILNILIIVGSVLVVSSFMNVSLNDGKWAVTFISSPNIILLIIGAIPLLVITIRSIFTPVSGGVIWSYSKKVKSKFDRISVSIENCKIEDYDVLPDNYAIVLPANTSFIDDCINDRRSALGSYVFSRIPQAIESLRSEISQILTSLNIHKDQYGNYPPGTSIILPKTIIHTERLILTASSLRVPEHGFASDIQTICRSIEQIFRITANERIGQLRIPILGSGHGGVSPRLALTIMLLSIGYYSKQYHHITNIQICVLDKQLMSASLMNSTSQLFKLEGK